MQPSTSATVPELAELMEQLNKLPKCKLQWFLDQALLLEAGEPNAIEGTAPIPDWVSKDDGEADNAASPK